MSETRQSTVRQRLLAIIVAGVGSFLAAAASFGMSVYEAANPPPLPVRQAGDRLDTGRWTVTLHSARIATTPPTGVPPSKPTTYLMLELDALNMSATPSYLSTNLLSVGPDMPDRPDVYLARDEALGGPLNPGMEERLIVVWELPADRPPPASLRVLVGSQIYKVRDNLYGASGWFDREPVAAVELAVAGGNA